MKNQTVKREDNDYEFNLNSDKYKEEKIKRKAEHEKATHDSDKEENIQEEEQADYYEDSIIKSLLYSINMTMFIFNILNRGMDVLRRLNY